MRAIYSIQCPQRTHTPTTASYMQPPFDGIDCSCGQPSHQISLKSVKGLELKYCGCEKNWGHWGPSPWWADP